LGGGGKAPKHWHTTARQGVRTCGFDEVFGHVDFERAVAAAAAGRELVG
jgi:hypothetical protein